MPNQIFVDICVVGGGSGGLYVAAGASQMGADVALIESGEMGGDCLNRGCVPSKALIAAAHTAHTIKSARRFGIEAAELKINFKAVHDHIHEVIGKIAPQDSVERFEGLGVRIIRARGRFVGPTEVQAGDTTVRAKRIVIATGSRPSIPLIQGLDSVPFLTNETIFSYTKPPSKLVIIGGGTIGSELAQAYCRLGCHVTILDIARILNNDDPELTEVVRTRMLKEGVVFREEIEIMSIQKAGLGVAIDIKDNGKIERINGSDLLVAAGRAPNLDGLDLEKAGIEYDRHGIKIDKRLRTSNSKVFAIGDVVGGFHLTHVAAYHAGVVLRNALFRLPTKVNYSALPRVTFTDPEIAHVGMTEAQARKKFGDIRVLRHPFAENDRAQAQSDVDGLAKIITDARGNVVGASIVGPQAGELIQSWILLIKKKMKIGTVAGLIIPYPTLGEVNKRAAGSFYTSKLFSEKTKQFVRLLLKLG